MRAGFFLGCANFLIGEVGQRFLGPAVGCVFVRPKWRRRQGYRLATPDPGGGLEMCGTAICDWKRIYTAGLGFRGGLSGRCQPQDRLLAHRAEELSGKGFIVTAKIACHRYGFPSPSPSQQV